MYLLISLLVLRVGCGILLYQFLIIAYLFTLDSMPSPEELFDHIFNLNKLPSKFEERASEINKNLKQSESGQSFYKLDFTITKDEII